MTVTQIDDLKNRAETVRQLSMPQLHVASDPHSRLFVMPLDGTKNDAFKDPEHITNVGLINRAIRLASIPNVVSGYVQGVGNQPLIAGTVDSALGLTVEDQAIEAYNKFVAQANAWHQQDPHVKISLVGVGFSRGAAALLVAANMVHEKGIPDYSRPEQEAFTDPKAGVTHTKITHPHFIIPPGEVRQALILNDQVASGKSEELDRTVPPSVVSVVQLKAEHEYRGKFPFYDVQDPAHPDPRIVTLSFPGAHSDIGGSYKLNGISSQTLLVNEIILNKYGANLPESKPETDPAKYVIHDSEYLWDNRPATSPTPPLETRPERTVILPEAAPRHATASTPESPSFRDQMRQALSGMTPEQLQIVFSRMQENLMAQPEIQTAEAGVSR